MSDWARLFESIQSAGLGLFIVFLRVGTASALLPAFGERSIPARLRLIIALAFTSIVYPAVEPEIRQFLNASADFTVLCLTEISLGIMLGLALRMTVMVLQIAGTIIAQSVSLSQVFASAGAEPVTVIGELLILAGLALAVTLGLHIELARYFIASYQSLPLSRLPEAGDAAAWMMRRAAEIMQIAFALAMPFVGGALIYNFALGMINKAMPQLMVAMIGAPALTLGGLALLMICAPLIIAAWIEHLGDHLLRPF